MITFSLHFDYFGLFSTENLKLVQLKAKLHMNYSYMYLKKNET